MTAWVMEASRLLGLYIVPGERFVLTRDILVYPRGHFLATGLLGLCGVALYPRKTDPFLDMSLFTPGFMDKTMEFHMLEYTGPNSNKTRVAQNVVRLRDYVKAGFRRKGGRVTATAEKEFNRCVKQHRLPPIS